MGGDFMKKKQPKVNDEQKKKIIKYYEEGKTSYEIADKIYEEYGVDISPHWTNVIINEYCKENNLERRKQPIHKFIRKEISEMSKEEIKEILIQSLKQGRPASKVYEIAKKYDIDIKKELKEYNFYINEDTENEK